MHDALVLQGTLLSDAADMFDEAGLREAWERHLSRVFPHTWLTQAARIWENARAQSDMPHIDPIEVAALQDFEDDTDVEAEAQARREHGTITAQKDLPVHGPAD